MRHIVTLLFSLLAFQAVAQVDRIELGWQTTRRGIVWHRDTLPRHEPQWRFSRDTNAVLWVDTTTAIRYDWDYKNDRWRAKGAFKDSLPPMPQYYHTLDSVVLDYTTLLWIRDTFNILHKYDSTCQAWTPIGDWIYGDTVPSNITATDSNGAAIYTRSLWQKSTTNIVHYWDGDSWEQFDDGIYGDGSPGSGSDTLPPGGSNVTIPGPWQPLSFSIANGPGTFGWQALVVNSAYCADDAFVNILTHTTPQDSFIIYDYDCETHIRQYERSLRLLAGLDIVATADNRILLDADSIDAQNLASVTTAPWIVAQSGAFNQTLRRMQGTASGQVLKWNGSAWALSQDSVGAGGGGTLNAAENGLYVSGTTVRLGTNALIEPTAINHNGNRMDHYGGKWVYNSHTSGSYTPTQNFGIAGPESLAGISTPAVDAILELRPNSGATMQENTLAFGGYPTDANGMWMQSRAASAFNTYYPLIAQPRGGKFAVGRNNIPQGHVTFTTSGLTGSTASGRVLMLEHSEGNGIVGMGLGTGADNLSAEVTFQSSANAMRITNRSTTNNSSTVRIALGADTDDAVTFVKSAATTKVKSGFGIALPASVHSTVQSAGSLATAFTQTTTSLTLTEIHHTVIYTLNGTINFTLPDPSTCKGRQYVLHHFGSAGNIGLNYSVISSTGTTFNSLGGRNWAWIISDGTNWRGYRLTSS